jgi:hypothetical protein
MPSEPELVYDADNRDVLVEAGDGPVHLYSDVSRSEFDLLESIDDFATEASALLDVLLDTMPKQRALLRRNEYFQRLGDLQQETASHYAQCTAYQEQVREHESEVLEAQLGILYKLEKLLKHYFRCLSAAQSLGFSQRLLERYMGSGDYVFLYAFVRNTCSSIEYLGTLVENRMGQGDLEMEKGGESANQVYRELRAQDLDGLMAEEQVVQIQPTGQSMQMGEIPLTTASMEFVWNQRNKIVHHCPLVMEQATAEMVPEEILSGYVLTEDEITKLTHLCHRLHLHSLGLFMNFCKDYTMTMVTELVEARYLERGDS